MDGLLDTLEEWLDERRRSHAPAPSLREALEHTINIADLPEVWLHRIDALLVDLAEDVQPCRCRHGDWPSLHETETTEGGW